MARIAVLIATFLYVGYFPVAPGTAGSAAALVLFAAVRAAGSSALEIAAIAGVLVAGTWAATEAERGFGRPDPGPVVIDEVLGMLVTLAFVPVGVTGAAIGFVLFRVFDVVKPWPVNRLEELPKGLGIMSDDLLAGVYANVALRVVGWLMPAWV